VAEGAYVLREAASGTPQVVLLGTGSEVHVCLAAADLLESTGVACRVVSFPSWDLFAAQPDEYRASVLPPGIPRLAVEAASSFGWERYADATVTIDHFGASAPGDVAMEEFGFTPQHVATRATSLVTGPSAT
jgi:transketolase